MCKGDLYNASRQKRVERNRECLAELLVERESRVRGTASSVVIEKNMRPVVVVAASTSTRYDGQFSAARRAVDSEVPVGSAPFDHAGAHGLYAASYGPRLVFRRRKGEGCKTCYVFSHTLAMICFVGVPERGSSG